MAIKAKPKPTPHNSIPFSTSFFFYSQNHMKKFELVFIPAHGAGHLASAVEMANVVVTRDPRVCVTMLIHTLPFDTKATQQIQSISAAFGDKAISFVVLPQQPPPHHTNPNFLLNVLDITESYKPSVAEAVLTKLKHPLLGFVVDLFCTTMIDVANQFQVPCYVYYTSNAGSLAILLALQHIYDEGLISDGELAVSGFVNPVPCKLIPNSFVDDEAGAWFYNAVKRIRSECKGVLINTFVEMEPHILNSITTASALRFPPLFPIGPVLHLKNTALEGADRADQVLKWLDLQPPSSVILLCFGSMGSFGREQVLEIARALERSGARFVWSLRQPSPKGKFSPVDYVDIGEDLPNGFLQRTAERGKVIGWAPQVEILAHSATGGFVSHCGWNSTLESVWHGVPMITWPMYAEQQLNAFEMAVELGLAVKMVIDYDFSKPRLVRAEEIERGIRRVMEDDGKIRERVKAKSEESRTSVMEGGSSFISLGHFIDHMFANTQGDE